MICLVCYIAEVEDTCPDCDGPLTCCSECAMDMGENFCPECDKEVD